MLDNSITSLIFSNATIVEPSESIKEIVKYFSEEIEIVFFEHPRLQKSLYYQSTIYVNIRLTFWRNREDLMKNPDIPAEVIALRIMHEIGHIVNGHEDNIIIRDGNVTQLVSDYKLMRQTQDAWDWAILMQNKRGEIYDKLVNACQEFEENYNYVNPKNW